MAHSFLAFLCTLITYIFLIITIYGDQENVAASLASDAGDKAVTNTFIWNILVDYGSMTIRVVGIHAFAAFRMNKNYRKLRSSLDKTENFLSRKRTREENNHYYRKHRKLTFFGIAYILTAV